jgi:hypothetical protein
MMHSAILAVHIGMGTIGVVTGAAALILRKGSGPHRVAGTVFFLSMIFMGATAFVLAAMLSQSGLAVGGLLTIYFIATAWMAGRRKDGETGAFEIWAFVFAVVLGPGLFTYAVLTDTVATDPKNPYLPFAQYAFNAFMVVAALGDLSVVLRGGISGAQRIARHLWRMCFGFFIAVGSFAAQGAKSLPPGVGVRVLLASMIIIFGMMLFWLVRVLFTSWWRQAEPAPP